MDKEKIQKFSLPISILRGAIILGGFYFGAEYYKIKTKEIYCSKEEKLKFENLGVPDPFTCDLKYQPVEYRARIILSWVKEQKSKNFCIRNIANFRKITASIP